MKKTLEVYGYGLVQDCFGLLTILKNKGFLLDDFLSFVEKSKKENAPIRKKEQPKEKTKQPNFLVPGDLVKMEGVVCSKCGNKVYTTAVCCSNPLKAQGFLRKTICSSCGLETGQK